MDDRPSPTFLTLPEEVRLIIYGFCLEVGKVFPFNREIKKDEGPLPHVALLRVCEKIHLEAEPILYRNTFVFSTHQAIEKLFEVCFNTQKRKLLLRSVEVRLSDNGADLLETLTEVRRLQRFFYMARVLDYTQTLPVTIFHMTEQSNTETDWKRTVSLILDNLSPDRLTLGLTKFQCPIKCCDMPMAAIMCFSPGFAFASPRTVKLVGLEGSNPTVEHRMDDSYVVELFEKWTSKRAEAARSAPATTDRLPHDAEKSLEEKSQAELVG